MYIPYIHFAFWLVNVAAFCTQAWDKHRATYGQYRIPEAVLLLLAVIGGAFGACCAMALFRHKTRKKKFYITVPLLAAIQLAAYGACCWLRLF